jgi:hypothetical protein
VYTIHVPSTTVYVTLSMLYNKKIMKPSLPLL